VDETTTVEKEDSEFGGLPSLIDITASIMEEFRLSTSW
jgi:hypothetical protein